MSEIIYDTWPQFYTATIHKNYPLLREEKYKKIVTDCLKFLVDDKRITLNAFVIMDTHIHLIWQACNGHILKNVQHSFLKFTAQKIKFDLVERQSKQLEHFKINSADREYTFWKRRSLEIELFSPGIFQQKLNYIHENPVKAGICIHCEDYYYSSAMFYFNNSNDFGMLTE